MTTQRKSGEGEPTPVPGLEAEPRGPQRIRDIIFTRFEVPGYPTSGTSRDNVEKVLQDQRPPLYPIEAEAEDEKPVVFTDDEPDFLRRRREPEQK